MTFLTINKTTSLTFAGVKACMKSMRPVDEEPYEVGLDNHGCRNGPRTGRLSALDNVSFLLMNASEEKCENVLGFQIVKVPTSLKCAFQIFFPSYLY